MAPRLSTRAERVRPFVHGELVRTSRRLRAEGRAVLDLARSVPPGSLPRALREEAERAWADGDVDWVVGAGLPDLRDAVVDWLGLRPWRGADDVLIAPGIRAATAAVVAAVAGSGDVVLVDAASWSSFRGVVGATGAVPVPVVPADPALHFLKLGADDVRHHLQLIPGARALLIASPVNPTAQVYEAETLAAILDACAAAEVFLVVDRLYGRLVYDGQVLPELPSGKAAERWLVVVDGPSRAFPGTGGLRVGWACGPGDVVEAAVAVLAQGAGPAERVSQRVALAALRAPYDFTLVEELQVRRDLLLELFAEVAGARSWPVPATPFALLDLQDLLGRTVPAGWVLDSAGDLADFFLAEAGVLLAPVEIPGQRGQLRASFTAPPEVLAQAAWGVRRAVDKLGPG